MFLLLILAIIFSGLALIAGFILGIVGLASDKPKMRNGGFITFGIGLIAIICSIYLLVTGVVNKVKETIEPFGNMIDSLNTYPAETDGGSLLNDNRNYLLDDTCTNPQIKYIKDASAKKGASVPNSFYTYFGAQGFARMPLVYPYAVHCWDSKDNGTLVNEEKVVDIETNPGGEENLVFNISAINYDENVILMRVSSLQTETNRNAVAYMLYSATEKKNTEYKTEAELFKAAKKAGYKGEKNLISLWDYDAMF